MPSDAARLETLGKTEVELVWRAHRLRVPLDLDRWPTYQIQTGQYLTAVELLTMGQNVDLVILDDARELSDAAAAAIGIERLPEQPEAPDQWFGAIPTLLELLRNHELDLASDLKQFWGVELDDRHREPGDPARLSLRKVWTYARRLPSASAVARAKNGGRTVWTEEMFIGAGIWEALTGKHYEGRPMKPEELERLIAAMQAKAEHVAKLKASAARYAPPETLPGDPVHAGSPLDAVIGEAVANRRRELGLTEDDHPR